MQNIYTKFNKVIAAVLLVLAVAFTLAAFPASTFACATNTCPPPTPDVLGTCFVAPLTVGVNQQATWTANASGGNGSYTYSWSGTDGLTGSSKNLTVSYATAGTKIATVAITSGNLTIQRSCTLYVTGQTNNPLNISCVANPSSANVNDSVTYSATVSGGNGNYYYVWTGTDGLYGQNQTVSKQYFSAGSKTATVTVTSNGQSQTATCTSNIQQQNNLAVYCSANPSNVNVNQTVTYSATASGGNGNYNYSWSGNNLSGNGQSVSTSYSNSGTQTATVTVTSNGQSQTATCTTNVGQSQNNLSASCYGTPSNANTNQQVTWYGNATGGNGNYTYSWSGTDGLYGYNQVVYKNYTYSGQKTATLTINSNGQTYTTTCYVNINNTGNVTLTQNPTGQLSSGVFLSQVPYTGGGPSLKVTLFVLGLLLFSAFAAYMILAKGKKNEFATPTGSLSVSERIAKFKKENAERINHDYTV